MVKPCEISIIFMKWKKWSSRFFHFSFSFRTFAVEKDV